MKNPLSFLFGFMALLALALSVSRTVLAQDLEPVSALGKASVRTQGDEIDDSAKSKVIRKAKETAKINIKQECEIISRKKEAKFVLSNEPGKFLNPTCTGSNTSYMCEVIYQNHCVKEEDEVLPESKSTSPKSIAQESSVEGDLSIKRVEGSEKVLDRRPAILWKAQVAR